MENLRHQKYKKKQSKNRTLEIENDFNNFKSNISISDMVKFGRKELTKKRTLGMICRLV